MNLPANYLEKMKELLKDDYDAYLESFDEPSFHGLRINTRKISVEDFLKLSPFPLEPIPWTSDGFYYDESLRPAKHPFYYAGLYYLQEPSAMWPAEVLPIDEGDIILDVCAAPGGKSTKLLSKLKKDCVLFSNDISNSRAQALLRNIERFGGKDIYVMSEDTTKLAKNLAESFDKILVDAPCSGEGMFRKDPSLITSYLERDSSYYPDIQKTIVDDCVKMLKPGGMMVYSTCTFSKEEDEEIIRHILENKEMELVEIPNCKFHPGFDDLDKCTRLFPHLIKGEGHFTALLRKKGQSAKAKRPSYKDDKLPEDVINFLKDVTLDTANKHFVFNKGRITLEPNLDLNLKGLRFLRTGLLIGTYEKRFEPSQALAMALKKDEYKKTIDLADSDDRVLKYLKGETISVDTPGKGYQLLLVNGQPLGFGKLDGVNLKNKLDKGWRYQ